MTKACDRCSVRVWCGGRRTTDLLRTVPGVGEQLSLTLLANLPGMGAIDRRQIAALVGRTLQPRQVRHARQTARLERALPGPSCLVHGDVGCHRLQYRHSGLLPAAAGRR
ncbi:MAG: transposase [Dehalococcoidia bacterium]|nr:transposase [Dehalococcoidia bacterium]